MGYRWRNMYYLTGLPGWMRFGYSPGWVGGSPTGLPPTAEWIMSSGLLPQFRQYLSTGVIPNVVPADRPVTKEQELQLLEQQAKAIETQLEATRRRLEAVRKSPASEQGANPYFSLTPGAYPLIPFPATSPEEELDSLREYKRRLDEEVKGVEARIEELEKVRKNRAER